MSKHLGALAAGAVVLLAVAGAATSASAHRQSGWYPGCNCGPVGPTTHYKTVHTAKFLTRYHDVSVVKNVHRVHHVTNITQVQPIVHIHEVTRIHHHTMVYTSTAYHNVTEHLTPIRMVTHSVKNYYDCHCMR